MQSMLNPPSPNTFLPLIREGLTEDIGRGDITSNLFIPADAVMRAVIVAREPLVVAGIIVAEETFYEMDKGLRVTLLAADGQRVERDQALLRVEGNARSILAAERTALNFVGYLSGIATCAAEVVAALAGTKTIVLDTRKTLPAYRALAKYAVRCGGGRNHRLRLDDGVMVKDNHIALMGSLMEAIGHARAHTPALTKIEVECDALAQVQEALDAGADVIMLDNMTVEEVRTAVQMVAGRVPLEASGGMNLSNIRAYAEAGVDFISLGSLTHTVRNADVGLDAEAA
jgi:nicotinate-nucleotide pyrophosphorylase (carboxylating)